MKRSVGRALLRPQFVAALAVLAGFALRAFRLGYQELRGDETFGYFFSLNDFGRIVSATLELREPHPVASYWVQHAWLAAAGHSEFPLRFTSLWFSVLSIALIYSLARRLGLGAPSAALASALLALSPYALWHAQDARMYSMSLALTLLSSTLAVGFFRRPRWRTGTTYVLASLLALQTHYFAAFVIVAQNLWVLWRAAAGAKPGRFGKPVRFWAAGQIALSALLLPWLIVARETLTGYRGNGDSPALLDALLRTARALTAGEMAPSLVRSGAALAAGLILLLLLVGVVRRPASARRDFAFATLLLVTPLVATWVSSQGRPIFNERYLVAAVPGLLLLLAAAVDRPQPQPERGAAAALMGALLALSLVASGAYLFDPAYSKSRGWRELAAELRNDTRGFASNRAWVVGNGADPTLWYYYPGQATRWAIPPAPRDAAGAQRVTRELAKAGVERVVVPLSGDRSWDGEGIARGALAAHYEIIATASVAGREVIVAERAPQMAQPLGVSFAGGLRLESVALQPGFEIEPGALLGAHIRWAGPRAQLPPGIKISLQLLDAAGALAAQADAPLVLTDGRSSHGLRLPETLAPGTYRLIVALYHADAEGLPRLLTESGQDTITLGELRVR